jgi:hypothetical protein
MCKLHWADSIWNSFTQGLRIPHIHTHAHTHVCVCDTVKYCVRGFGFQTIIQFVFVLLNTSTFFSWQNNLKSVHPTKSSHKSWNFIPLREILPDWYHVPCSIWFCLFLPWTSSVTFWKHECRLCQLLSKHGRGLRFKSLTCRSLQFTVILIIMSHECVCVCASVYDFRHDHHKFVYEISQRMDCLGGCGLTCWC